MPLEDFLVDPMVREGYLDPVSLERVVPAVSDSGERALSGASPASVFVAGAAESYASVSSAEAAQTESGERAPSGASPASSVAAVGSAKSKPEATLPAASVRTPAPSGARS